MKPLLTVVMPVYNCEKYVDTAIRSVMDQPCADRVELLVIDDGSTDHSGSVCDKLALQYGNIRVAHKENGGVASARNLGIENANGKYIAFLDSDDWWEPGFLDEALCREFERKDSPQLYEFAYRRVNYTKKYARLFPVADETLAFDEPDPARYDWQPFCAFIYRTELVSCGGIRFPRARLAEDIAFIRMCFSIAKTLTKINKPIFSYYERLSSCIHSADMTDIIECKRESTKALYTYLHAAGLPIRVDVDRETALSAAENLRAVCSQLSYESAKEFIDSYCNRYLQENPGKQLWTRAQRLLDSYNAHPFGFWLGTRLSSGLAWHMRDLCYRIPGLRRICNHLISKYIYGMERIA